MMSPPQQHNITLPVSTTSHHQKSPSKNIHQHLNGASALNNYTQSISTIKSDQTDTEQNGRMPQLLEYKSRRIRTPETNTNSETSSDGYKDKSAKLSLTLEGAVCRPKNYGTIPSSVSNGTYARIENCPQADISKLLPENDINFELNHPMTTDRQCGLGSFFPMSCRGRAEAFARRLHSRLRSLGAHDVGGGNGSHTSSPDTDENTWLSTNEAPNPVTNLQPRHSADSEIFFDLGIFESPGSPVEEIPESEFTRLITNQKDELPIHHETCQCSGSTTKIIRCSDPDSGYSFSSPVTEETPGDSDTSEYFDTENAETEFSSQCANRKPNTLRTSEYEPNIVNDLKINIHRNMLNSPKGAPEFLMNGLPPLSPEEHHSNRNSSKLNSPVNIIVNPLESATFYDEHDLEDVSSLTEENDSLSNCTESSVSSIVQMNVLEQENDGIIRPDEVEETLEKDEELKTVEPVETLKNCDIIHTCEVLDKEVFPTTCTLQANEEEEVRPDIDETATESCNENESERICKEFNNNEEAETYCCSINIANEMTVTLNCLSTIPQVEVTAPTLTLPIENETESETCVAKAEVTVDEVYIEDKTKLCESSVRNEENDKISSDHDDEEIEERIPRVRRCSSLKTGKTPPGTPGRKKIVRFADVLGLDLADVRTFLDEIPKIPTSAFEDLVDADISVGSSNDSEVCPMSASNLGLNSLTKGQKPDKVLVPLFQQPGGQTDFIDKVRERQCCLENACIQDTITLSISGTVRVRNLDFHKSVHIRYTIDSWKNFADLQATYVPNSCDGFSDKFSFLLYAHTVSVGQRIEFAVRFQCKGCQYWDNNNGANYCFQCLPSSAHSTYMPITAPEEHWDGCGASFY